MRTVTWTDRNGCKHRSLVRDTDPDDAAPQGILQDPPDLERMDWDAVKRDLHNALVDAGLYSWREVQGQGDGLRGALLSATRKRLIALYREVDNDPSGKDRI
ncbi:MAG: hypothetical protein EHM35_00085 [Planctomycetaceae bacterium]|nr:MAG: hypothetical protein EHM35_00085 [Planctomycetaceae bacterium]